MMCMPYTVWKCTINMVDGVYWSGYRPLNSLTKTLDFHRKLHNIINACTIKCAAVRFLYFFVNLAGVCILSFFPPKYIQSVYILF